jgi:hypothetical protein
MAFVNEQSGVSSSLRTPVSQPACQTHHQPRLVHTDSREAVRLRTVSLVAPEGVMEMGRAAGLPTVGRSASDLPKASDLVMCAPIAGLANTLALIVTCARSIAMSRAQRRRRRINEERERAEAQQRGTTTTTTTSTATR